MKCFKCQNDTFDKSIILAGTLNKESKHHPGEDKFEVLTCKKCHLTQWYDYYAISGEKKPDREYEKLIYELPSLLEFTCFNCQSETSTIERIKPVGKIISAWEGEILVRICSKCGLTEMYEILLIYPGIGASVTRSGETIILAKDFNCPVCKTTRVSQTGEILFIESLGNQPVYHRQERETSYLFGTCKKCKYIMLFAGHLC